MKKLLFLIVWFPFLLNSQIIFDPLYNLSNTPSATSDYHSTYSMDNYFYAAWGDNGQVLFKKAGLGSPWSSNKLVTSSGSYPVIAARQDQVVILYHDLNDGVFAQKSVDGGNSWLASPITLSTHSSGITPQVTDGGVNLFAVWEERPGSNYELMFSRSTNMGSSWSTPVNISNTSTTSRWAQINAFGNTIYCTWIETSTYPLSDIYFIKSTDAGTTWSASLNITNDSRPQNRVYMESTAGGSIYLACDDITSYPVFNFDDIYLIKSTDAGSSWTTAINITSNPGHSNTPCILVVEPNIYFTWSDNTQSAPAYDNSDIYFKRSSDGGLTWTDSIKICSNSQTSSRPRFCWGWDGPLPAPWINLTIVWYDYSTGDSEILARNGIHYVPVELTSFTAESGVDYVNLYWTTASEVNNKGFEIERKEINSGEWIYAAFISGNGTTTLPGKYSYTDHNLSKSRYLYRLKQIDYDGTFSYSEELEVTVGTPEDFYLSQNYPNPFNPLTTIKFNLPADGQVTLKIYDLTGNEVMTLLNDYKSAGRYEIKVDASGLASGVYFYRMICGDYSLVKKLQVLK